MPTPANPPWDRPPYIAAPRARVITVEHPAATELFKPQRDIVRALVQQGITELARKPTAAAAWLTLVTTQDVVGIKVFSAPGPHVGTRPEVVAGIIEGLLSAGLPATNIVVWDRQLVDLRRAGFHDLAQEFGVRVAGALETGWDEATFYESALLGQPVFGDLEFQRKGDRVGRKSFVTKLLTKQITKIINVSPLLNHNSAGVSGQLYSLALGSVDNTLRFEGGTAKLSQAVPELYALPALGDRVVLNVVDALVCQYEGEQIGRLQSSAALNQLRFSTDPVALDVLSLHEIAHQRHQAQLPMGAITNRLELYRNAALLDLGVADTNKIDLESIRAMR